MASYVLNPLVEMYPLETDKLSVFHRGTGKSYTLGAKESAVLKLLDGSRSLVEIQRACPFYNMEELQGLMVAFGKIGLLAGTGESGKQPFYKLKLRLFNPNRVLRPGGFLTEVITGLTFLAPIVCVAGIALNTWGREFDLVFPVATERVLEALRGFGWPFYILLLLASFISLALHEFAHAAVARHYDVNVPEIGIMLYCLMPCAYTNLTGIRLLLSRRKRIMTLLAGSLANLNLIGVSYMLMAVVPNARICAALFGVILVNVFTIGLNCVIFLKFDGYYMVEVLLDEVNLKEKAVGFLTTWVRAQLGRNVEAKRALASVCEGDEGQLRAALYAAYGLVSMAYLPVFLGQVVFSLIVR